MKKLFIDLSIDAFADSLISGLLGYSVGKVKHDDPIYKSFPKAIGYEKPFKPDSQRVCVEVEITDDSLKPIKLADNSVQLDTSIPIIDIRKIYFSSQIESQRFSAQYGAMNDIPVDFFSGFYDIAKKSWKKLPPPVDSLELDLKSEPASYLRCLPAFIVALSRPISNIIQSHGVQSIALNPSARSSLINDVVLVLLASFATEKSFRNIEALSRMYIDACLDGVIDDRTNGLSIVEALKSRVKQDVLVTQKDIQDFSARIDTESKFDSLESNYESAKSISPDATHKAINAFIDKVEGIYLGDDNTFKDPTPENVFFLGLFAAMSCDSTKEIHRYLVQNGIRDKHVEVIASVLFGLRCRSSKVYQTYISEGTQSFAALNKTISISINAGEMRFKTRTVAQTQLEPLRETLVNNYRVYFEQLEMSPSLERVVGALKAQQYYPETVSEMPGAIVVDVYSNKFAKHVPIYIQVDEINAKIFAISKCKSKFSKATIRDAIFALTDSYDVAPGVIKSLDGSGDVIRLSRRQAVGTQDDSEIEGHLQDVASAVIELNGIK